MTSQTPEPAAEWPPSPEGRPAGHGLLPGGAPDEWPARGRHGSAGGSQQRASGERVATEPRPATSRPRGGVPWPLTDYTPETGYGPPPDGQPGPGLPADEEPPPSPPTTDFQPEGYPRHPAPDEYEPGENPGPDGLQPDGYEGHPEEAGFQPDGNPGPAPAADYQPDGYPSPQVIPDYPVMDDYDPDGYPPGGYPPALDYPSMPDYPPTPDYPPSPDYPPGPGYLTGPGHPPTGQPSPTGQPPPGYRWGGHPGGPPAGEYPANGFPAAGPLPPVGPWIPAGARIVEYDADADDEPARAPSQHLRVVDGSGADLPSGRSAKADDTNWALIAYLTVPFFGFVVPLVVYLLALRRSRWLRSHAAQALNVWLTVLLYDLSAVIIGAMLMLDSAQVAVVVVAPLVALLWLITLVLLVRAAAAASQGGAYTLPRWLCTIMVR
jgi:uncharacterized Tic20 family protein